MYKYSRSLEAASLKALFSSTNSSYYYLVVILMLVIISSTCNVSLFGQRLMYCIGSGEVGVSVSMLRVLETITQTDKLLSVSLPGIVHSLFS